MPVEPAQSRGAGRRTMLLTALYVAQEQYGSLTPEALTRVAERLGITPKAAYEAATFYSMFRTEPVGRYVLQVCEGLSCYLAGGAEDLRGYLAETLGISPGETTPDGLFTLQVVECLAACDLAPSLRVNDTLYHHVTPSQVDELLDALRRGG